MMLLLTVSYSFAQSPYLFNYQGVARDLNGQPIANQPIALKLAILATNDATTSEYEETQTATTNEFGLYTLQIGAGEKITGSMEMVKWDAGNKYIQVAIDPKGGTKYEVIGTTQLLSVPYAIYANKAGVSDKTLEGGDRTGAVNSAAGHAAPADNNYLTRFTGLNTIGKSSLLYDNGTQICIGTTAAPFAPSSYRFTVQNTSEVNSVVKTTSPSSAAAFRLWNSANKGLNFFQYGSAAPGTYFGNPIANMSFFTSNSGTLAFMAKDDVAFGSGTTGAPSELKMIVKAGTGNVGIGTPTPAAKLDIIGTIKITDGTEGANKILTSDPSGLATWLDPSITSVGGTTDFIPRYTPNGSTLGNSIIQQGNSAGFGSATGIGIGTNPLAGLHIKGIDNSFDAGLRLEEDAPGTTYSNILHGQEGLFVLTTNPLQDQMFLTSGSAANPNLIVKGGGNVGIGTSTPASKFEVKGFSPFTTVSSFTGNAGISINDIAVLGGEKWGIYTNVNGSSLQNVGVISDVNGNSSNNVGVLGLISTDPGVGNSEAIVAFDGINGPNTKALRVNGKSSFTGVATMSDVSVSNLQVTGGVPAEGKVLTSDATGNATWKENQTGGFNAGTGGNPTASTAFLGPQYTITITSNTQKVFWTATKAMGSTSAAGANSLEIYPGYNNSATPATIFAQGGGMFGLRCAQNTRQTYTVSGFITGLAPGTYNFGMVGSSSDFANWNNNEWGYVTAMLME